MEFDSGGQALLAVAKAHPCEASDPGELSLALIFTLLPSWALVSLACSTFITIFAIVASTRALLHWDTIHWPWSRVECCGSRLPGILDSVSPAVHKLRYAELAKREAALERKLRDIIGSEVADETEPWEQHAGRLKDLLRGGYLDLDSISDRERMLDFFAAHRVMARQSCLQCSLGIRMTVHCNLFCGTVLALGSEEQQDWLRKSHEETLLGCFMLTEKGAGVLSGLVVETVATWVWSETEGEGSFDLHTPSPSAAKTWISQGLAADWGVVVAQLVIEGECHGPHVFLLDMNSDGVSRTCMGLKSTFTALDNAQITFNHVRLPRDALLSKLCSVTPVCTPNGWLAKYSFVGSRPPSFLVVAQRLLSGRLCISDSAIAYLDGVLEATETYAAQRMVWIDKERQMQLAELPYMEKVFQRVRAGLNIHKAFLLLLQTQLSDSIEAGEDPPRDLVTMIAAAKVESVEFAINSVALLRRNVGAFGLMAASPFGSNNDILLCCRFAEGDSRVLQQLITRDLVRAHSQPAALLSLIWRVFKAWLSGAWRTMARLRYSRDLQLLRLLWLLRQHSRNCKSVSKAQAQTDAWLHAGDLVYNVAKAHAQLLIHSTVEHHFARSRDTDQFLAMSTHDCEVCHAY